MTYYLKELSGYIAICAKNKKSGEEIQLVHTFTEFAAIAFPVSTVWIYNIEKGSYISMSQKERSNGYYWICCGKAGDKIVILEENGRFVNSLPYWEEIIRQQ